MRLEGFLFGVFFIILGGFICYQLILKKRKRNYPKNVVILHQFPRIPVAPNMSPFAIKLETYLRMAKIPYKSVHSYEFSPKNKTPWITFNGKVISDTHFIIQFLNNEFKVDLNKRLNQKEKAIGRFIQKTLEENFFWCLVVSRWVHSSADPSLRKIMGLNSFLVWRVKSILQRQAYSQGIGRHNPDEVESIAREDLEAISQFLGEKKYLMGDEPCEMDCALFGMIALMWQMPVTSYFYRFIQENSFPRLTLYFNRMKKEFWPEWMDSSEIGSVYCDYPKEERKDEEGKKE